MKRFVKILLMTLVLMLGTSCSSIPETVPDSLLEVKIQECKEVYGFDDCDNWSIDKEHNPDKDSHIDTINIRMTAEYPFGDYVIQISDLVYQYDKSSDNWQLISKGKMRDTDVKWNIEGLCNFTYSDDGAYDPVDYYNSRPDKTKSMRAWDFNMSDFDPSDNTIFVSGGLDTFGKNFAWTRQMVYTPYQGYYQGFIADRNPNKYRKVLIFEMDDAPSPRPIICITPEEGVAYMEFDPTHHGEDPITIYDCHFAH